MKNIITRQKSRNDITIGQPSDQQTALPSTLHEIKSISKELFRLTKNDLENLSMIISNKSLFYYPFTT